MSSKAASRGEARFSSRTGMGRTPDEGFSLDVYGPSGLAHGKSVGYPHLASVHCSVAFLHAPFLHSVFHDIRLRRSFAFVRRCFAHDASFQMAHRFDTCFSMRHGCDARLSSHLLRRADYDVLVVKCQTYLAEEIITLEFVIEIK